MILADFSIEKKLLNNGIKTIAGVDEVGRGPLAGPVVAGAVVINIKRYGFWAKLGINDSKKLSAKKRAELARIIKQKADYFSLAVIDHTLIDQYGIRQATFLAMEQTIIRLSIKPDFVLIDGKDEIELNDIKQKAIIKGDQKSISIAAASILAKVHRDRMMQLLHLRYPGYGFNQHKGYGTKKHQQAIEQLGPCPIHRKSFSPIKDLFLD